VEYLKSKKTTILLLSIVTIFLIIGCSSNSAKKNQATPKSNELNMDMAAEAINAELSKIKPIYAKIILYTPGYKLDSCSKDYANKEYEIPLKILTDAGIITYSSKWVNRDYYVTSALTESAKKFLNNSSVRSQYSLLATGALAIGKVDTINDLSINSDGITAIVDVTVNAFPIDSDPLKKNSIDIFKYRGISDQFSYINDPNEFLKGKTYKITLRKNDSGWGFEQSEPKLM
jgi:hypothetical protein